MKSSQLTNAILALEAEQAAINRAIQALKDQQTAQQALRRIPTLVTGGAS